MGASGADRIATAAGLTPGEVERLLYDLGDAGLVDLDPGPFGGWSLTDAGRADDDAWLARSLEEGDTRQEVQACYERFLGLNPQLLDICSAWQMRTIGGTPTLNDHTDADYDAGVLTRLMRLDDEAQPLCADLAGALERYAVYGNRLKSALDRVIAGDHPYFADGLESYHAVWFQLHEDLLTTLGISREDERRG